MDRKVNVPYVVLRQREKPIDWAQGKEANGDVQLHGNSKNPIDQPAKRDQVCPCIVGRWGHLVVSLNGRICQISCHLN